MADCVLISSWFHHVCARVSVAPCRYHAPKGPPNSTPRFSMSGSRTPRHRQPLRDPERLPAASARLFEVGSALLLLLNGVGEEDGSFRNQCDLNTYSRLRP